MDGMEMNKKQEFIPTTTMSDSVQRQEEHCEQTTRSTEILHKEKNGCHQSENKKISNQLLYSERFEQCYKEEKLGVVGKSSKSSGSTEKASKTFTVPQSSVLSKAKDFLSLMSQSNSALSARLAQHPEEKSEVDIGIASGGEENPQVEMDLMFIPPEALDSAVDDDDSSATDSSDSDAEEVDQCLTFLRKGSDELSSDKTTKDEKLMKLKLPRQNCEGSAHNTSITELDSGDSATNGR